ncbi:MAG: hypothetical protein FWD12_14150, partial [Alphaproteobacteria bacterium]|nr:hypothetical protein [Alphaproteobacteria bacterium]
TAAHGVLPRAHESYRLLEAQDEPAALADIAVDKALSAPVARTEIENALNNQDPELAASFLELARDRGIAVDPQLAQRVDDANAASAQVMRAAANFGHGLVTGAPDDLAGFAGTAAGDLFVFGDIRDAVREGRHLARGEPGDELILGLACAGILVTAATYTTLGAAAPERIGLSFVKAARRTGRLAAPVAQWMTRSVREVVDTKALAAALDKASITAPAEALRLARDAVKVDRAEGVIATMRDIGRVRTKAGTRAALDGLRLSEGSDDVARLARLAETKGSKTRAILKLAGRAGFVLTAAAFDLLSWMFAALCTVFGFCSAVKRTTERTTERYLRWRKRRRARRREAVAAAVAATG